MECNSCDRKTPDRSGENRNIEKREACSEKKDCGSGRNVNCNMNRNSNYNMNRSMNCNMNRSSNNMNRSMNYNMNRSSNNMNRGMNYNMNRSTNNNMNRNMDYNMNRSSNNMSRNSDEDSRCEMTRMMSEGCNRGTEPVDEMNPGMAFVPWQEWKDVYCMEEGLENGTIFSELNKPYTGRMTK